MHGSDYVSPAELAERSPGADEHGDADFYVVQADLLVRYALTEEAELTLDAPYKVNVLRVSEEDAHHRNETLHGPGDVQLSGKYYFLSLDRLQLAASLGLRMPTGARNETTRLSYVDHEDAEALGITIPEHSHLQLGTGTLDPFAGVETLVRFDDHWMMFTSLSGTAPLYATGDGYRTAPAATVRLGPAVSLGEPKLLLSLFVETLLAGRDHLRGGDVVGRNGMLSGDLDVPNTGRSEWALAPAATWWATDAFSLNLRVRVPFFTRIDERAGAPDVQLTELAGFGLGLSYDLDTASP